MIGEFDSPGDADAHTDVRLKLGATVVGKAPLALDLRSGTLELVVGLVPVMLKVMDGVKGGLN